MIEFRGSRIASLDDIEVDGRRILVRVDMNSPVDRQGRILDASRIAEAARTIGELVERKAAVVVMSHQGRPLEGDFISLEQHSKILSKLLGIEVKFVDDVFGPEARRAISSLRQGEVLVLENTRICSEDVIEAEPEKHSGSMIVEKLYKLFDFYVNDAFSACHRSQATLVGFPMVLPSAAGRVMEAELRALSKALDGGFRRAVFVIGGAKVQDALRAIRGILSREGTEVLTVGLVAQLFLYAKGVSLPKQAVDVVLRKASENEVAEARNLMEEHSGRIYTPVDFVVMSSEPRVEPVQRLSGVPADIGPKTIELYEDIMRGVDVVVIRGPAGIVEDPRFRVGSAALIEGATRAARFVIVGGGHLLTVLRELPREVLSRVGHVSTGGGVLLELFAKGTLPCIEALAKSYERFKHVYLR